MWHSLVFWRLCAMAGLLAALGLAVVAASGRPDLAGDRVSLSREVVWVLVDGQKRPRLLVKLDRDGRRAVAVPLEMQAEPGKDFQLWLVPTSGASGPKSLGLVKPTGVTTLSVDESALAGSVDDGILAVSVEAPGGASGGVPAGPVILEGRPVPVRPPE